MGETTTLALAATKKMSLRTTVPMSIVKQFNLGAGDKLDWTLVAKGVDEMIIIVHPVRTAKGET